MIQQRTLLRPGEGIVREEGPVTEQKRYPLVMTHPAYQKGVPDKEIKIIDEATGKWTGFLRYEGHQPIRFPPVLVRNEDDEGNHAAQGYVPGQTCTPEEFARFVQTTEPPVIDYQPVEYPKWVHGRVANSVEEEADILDELGMRPTPAVELSSELPSEDPPSVSTEETKEERIARLKRELAELENDAVVKLVEPVEPLVMKEPTLNVTGLSDAELLTPEQKRQKRSDAIKAGIARRKAEKAAQEPVPDSQR